MGAGGSRRASIIEDGWQPQTKPDNNVQLECAGVSLPTYNDPQFSKIRLVSNARGVAWRGVAWRGVVLTRLPARARLASHTARTPSHTACTTTIPTTTHSPDSAGLNIPDSFLFDFDFNKMGAGGGKGGNLLAIHGDYVVKEMNTTDHNTLLNCAKLYAGEIQPQPLFSHGGAGHGEIGGGGGGDGGGGDGGGGDGGGGDGRVRLRPSWRWAGTVRCFPHGRRRWRAVAVGSHPRRFAPEGPEPGPPPPPPPSMAGRHHQRPSTMTKTARRRYTSLHPP